ncbi:MAG: hypothetical protein HYT93_04080 [Parcubacteria group bacterium]|nr:hypothetical protein [Parcubacteria group bacterium]
MKTKIIIVLAGMLIIASGWLFLGKEAENVQPIPPETILTQPKEFTLVVENKKIISGPETITIKQGETVSIIVTADEDEEFHLHGYDRSVDLEKGVPAILTFKASASGRFMFELEESKTDIGALEVLP